MMEPYWWVRTIDWRISSGVIFSLLLFLWGNENKRSRFYWRLVGSTLLLGTSSWVMRYIIEEWLSGNLAVSIGHSLYLLALSFLFFICYRFCCKRSISEYLYITAVALTVYRIAWNVNKVITVGLVQFPLPWPSEKARPLQSLSAYVIYSIVCILCFLVYRKLANKKNPLSGHNSMLLLNIVLWFQVVLELSYRLVNPDDGSSYMLLFFFTSLIHSLMSYALVLIFRFMDALRQDKSQMENFIASKQKYYEISKEGILSLQTKCHDLKHQIELIRSTEGKLEFDRYVDRLAESIDEYNTVIETGNKIIDVVLTEKNIICHSKGIKFSYMFDGTLFNFLSEMDIYALFGNIMDNAIESMLAAKNQARFYVIMKAAQRADMVVLYVENYYENQLVYEQGILVTTKENKLLHGYGLRSINEIAGKYGGMVSINAENQVFKLTVTLKLPDQAMKDNA